MADNIEDLGMSRNTTPIYFLVWRAFFELSGKWVVSRLKRVNKGKDKYW